jgi:hypothetical protein
VDNLDTQERRETYVEQSQVVAIFLSKGYFFDSICLRELDCALALNKPLILIHEADPLHGGASLESIRAECASKRRMQVFEADDEARPVITWHRVTDFQLVCMTRMCSKLLHASPVYKALEEPPKLYVPGSVSNQAFSFERRVKLHVSPHNPGAWDLAEELKARCDSWKVMRSIVLKSKPLDIREGRRAEALESTPPPSPPDVEVQSERSTDGNRMRSSPRASLPRELRRLSFPIPIYGQDTSQRASGRASERVSTHQMRFSFSKLIRGWDTTADLHNTYKLPHVKATHFLLYLNQQTFVGEEGAKLAAEVRQALDSWLPIVLVHEQDHKRRGCSLEQLHHNTPEDLLNQGLLKKPMVLCHPAPLREVSLTLIAKALGAMPVLTRSEEMLNSPKKVARSTSKSIHAAVKELRTRARSCYSSVSTEPSSSASKSSLSSLLTSMSSAQSSLTRVIGVRGAASLSPSGSSNLALASSSADHGPSPSLDEIQTASCHVSMDLDDHEPLDAYASGLSTPVSDIPQDANQSPSGAPDAYEVRERAMAWLSAAEAMAVEQESDCNASAADNISDIPPSAATISMTRNDAPFCEAPAGVVVTLPCQNTAASTPGHAAEAAEQGDEWLDGKSSPSQARLVVAASATDAQQQDSTPPPGESSSELEQELLRRQSRMSNWEPDEDSTVCSNPVCSSGPFSWLNRKHHCRACGRIFCDSCSSTRTQLPPEHGYGMQRVCDGCAVELEAGEQTTIEGQARVDAIGPSRRISMNEHI